MLELVSPQRSGGGSRGVGAGRAAVGGCLSLETAALSLQDGAGADAARIGVGDPPCSRLSHACGGSSRGSTTVVGVRRRVTSPESAAVPRADSEAANRPKMPVHARG